MVYTSVYSPVLTLVVLVYLNINNVQCQLRGAAVIMSGPQDQILAPGEVAYFNCHARGDSVYWYVNGNDPYPERNYKDRGFNFTYTEIPRPSDELEEHNNTIIIDARSSNNNTHISCTATGWIYGQHAYVAGRLIIAGPPLPPSVVVNAQNIVNNTFTISLNWSQPFTWPGFPITSYNATLISNTGNQRIHNTSIVRGIGLETMTQQYQFTTMGNSCYESVFYIKANNSIGESQSTHITFGHPISVQYQEIEDVETLVTLHPNGSPHFWMSFLAPWICPRYQLGTYSIRVRDVDSDNQTHHIGPIAYQQIYENQQQLITKDVRTGLIIGAHYEMDVIVESLGAVTSRKVHFQIDTFFYLECSVNATMDDIIDDTDPDLAGSMDTTAIAIGTILLLLVIFFVAIIVLLLFLLMRQRRLTYFTKNETDGFRLINLNNRNISRPRIENTNPIYEGALYETTPGESLKLILSSPGTPSTPIANGDTTHQYVEQPPNLPPPRGLGVNVQPHMESVDEIDAIKASIKQAEAELPQLDQPDGEYMIMGPNNSTPKASSKKVPSEQSNDKVTSADGNCEEKYVTMDELH